LLVVDAWFDITTSAPGHAATVAIAMAVSPNSRSQACARCSPSVTHRGTGAPGQIIPSEGTLYPLPARLRRNGLVETWQESNAGPPRRYYHLTSDRELALASFTKPWPVFRDAVEEILSEGSQR
jgi:Transcriptional regulator PadR-like family